MDSRLINVFHDDPFDANFTKFEHPPSYWSNESDSIDMQLSETLQGILPINTTEEASIIYGNTLSKDRNEDMPTPKNALIYNDFAEHQFNDGDSIRILTVDPEADCFDSAEDDEDDDDSINGEIQNFFCLPDNLDTQSQCSNSTFRTRTDSSSIGDYESHSSDYDDDSEEGDVDFKKNQFDETPNLEGLSDFAGCIVPDTDLALDSTLNTNFNVKNRTISTNTNCSDVDGFGINIDANNFDLAEFITKDDFAINNHINTSTFQFENGQSIASKMLPGVVANILPPVVKEYASKHTESDSDSDAIVDVETVEFEENDCEQLFSPKGLSAIVHEDNIAFTDNVKTDPSWCPKAPKKTATVLKEIKSTVSTNNQTASSSVTNADSKSGRNICLVPNKKQCDFLKRKFGAARNKVTLTTSARIGKTVGAAKKIQEIATGKRFQNSITTSTPCIGMGQGGKNLALLKNERVSISEQSSEESTTPLKTTGNTAVQNTIVKSNENAINVKKKLNLEEYKKRRGDCGIFTNTPPQKQSKLQSTIATNTKPTSPTISTKPTTHKTSPTKHNEAITSIVKSLKSPSTQKPATDPITEAKNKVLRMQELKRAQQLKILDSTVSAKVARVTKLPPLKEIVKDTYCVENEDKQLPTAASRLTHPDYESIVIVSASCNTDLSIPPFGETSMANKSASRSLLKSSALLYNISNSFQKVQQASDKTKCLNNSLIASIQKEVVKKTLPTVDTQTNVVSDIKSEAQQHHGEDKVIMYLPKNRTRIRTKSISTQTDLQPEFPLLTLLTSSTMPASRKSRERTRQKSRRNYRKRNSSSMSSSECSIVSDCSQRTASNSSNSSAERLRNSDPSAVCGYSSRSTRRHRSSVSSSFSEAEHYERTRRQRRTSYNKRRSKRQSRSNSLSSSEAHSDRERSRSPLYRRSRSRSNSRSGTRYNNNRRNFTDRNVSQPAVEERRIVYVGRIEQETTKEMLRRKFIQYGTIKQITIHYKETGMKYGFVTFERAQDAFTVIDSSAKNPQINMYDISFGGRRAFCRASYADLDNAGINNYHSYVFPTAPPPPKEDDSFEALLLKVKAKLHANKPNVPQAGNLNSAAAETNASAANQGEQNDKI